MLDLWRETEPRNCTERALPESFRVRSDEEAVERQADNERAKCEDSEGREDCHRRLAHLGQLYLVTVSVTRARLIMRVHIGIRMGELHFISAAEPSVERHQKLTPRIEGRESCRERSQPEGIERHA